MVAFLVFTPFGMVVPSKEITEFEMVTSIEELFTGESTKIDWLISNSPSPVNCEL